MHVISFFFQVQSLSREQRRPSWPNKKLRQGTRFKQWEATCMMLSWRRESKGVASLQRRSSQGAKRPACLHPNCRCGRIYITNRIWQSYVRRTSNLLRSSWWRRSKWNQHSIQSRECIWSCLFQLRLCAVGLGSQAKHKQAASRPETTITTIQVPDCYNHKEALLLDG